MRPVTDVPVRNGRERLPGGASEPEAVLNANRLVVVGFCLVLAGAVLPFLMVIRLLPSPLWLSVVSYASSVTGLFLGVIAAAMIYAERRRDGDEGG